MQEYSARVEARGSIRKGSLSGAAMRSMELSVYGAMEQVSSAIGGGDTQRTSTAIDAVLTGFDPGQLGNNQGRSDTEYGGGPGLASVRVDPAAYYGRRLLATQYDSAALRMDDQLLYAAEQAYRHMRQHYNSEPLAHLLASEFYRGFYHETAFA